MSMMERLTCRVRKLDVTEAVYASALTSPVQWRRSNWVRIDFSLQFPNLRNLINKIQKMQLLVNDIQFNDSGGVSTLNDQREKLWKIFLSLILLLQFLFLSFSWLVFRKHYLRRDTETIQRIFASHKRKKKTLPRKYRENIAAIDMNYRRWTIFLFFQSLPDENWIPTDRNRILWCVDN